MPGMEPSDPRGGKRWRPGHRLLLAAGALVLSHCGAPELDPGWAGRYRGERMQELLIEPDGTVAHFTPSSDRSPNRILGWARPVEDQPSTLTIWQPDSSRFLGTVLQQSDEDTVVVRWVDRGAASMELATVYERDRE